MDSVIKEVEVLNEQKTEEIKWHLKEERKEMFARLSNIEKQVDQFKEQAKPKELELEESYHL